MDFRIRADRSFVATDLLLYNLRARLPNLRPVKHANGDAPGYVDQGNKIRVEKLAPHLLRITIGKEAKVYEVLDPDTFSRIEDDLRKRGK
jgi:hypothetical protein